MDKQDFAPRGSSPVRVGSMSRRRSSRRAAVVLTYGGFGMTLLLWQVSHLHGPLTAATFLCAVACLSGLFVLTRPAIWTGAHGTDAMLDERERAVRNRSYLASYAVLATLMLLGVLYWDLGVQRFGLWAPRSEEARQALLWTVLLLVLTLPNATLAWTEPDAQDEA